MLLVGGNEVPPNASTATATATVTLNQVTGAVTVNGTYAGLTPTAGHIHQPALAGSIADPVTPTFTFPAGTMTFSYTGILTAPQVANVLNGMSYVNIHSLTYMPGEIRGQIL